MKRTQALLGIVVMATACSSGEQLCPPLSPACARSDADLRVDLTAIPREVSSVELTVIASDGERDFSTSRIEDGRVSFFVFDLPDGELVEVRARTLGSVEIECEKERIETGVERTLTIDVTGADCERHGEMVADGGAPSDAGQEDSGEDEEPDEDGGCSGNGCDGGPDALLLLSERIESASGDEEQLTEVIGTGDIFLRGVDGGERQARLAASELADIEALVLQEAFMSFMAGDGNACTTGLPGHRLRVVTRLNNDEDRDVAGCEDDALDRVVAELERLRTVHFP